MELFPIGVAMPKLVLIAEAMSSRWMYIAELHNHVNDEWWLYLASN